ncbi:MAG: hypothetical protein D3909_05855 [Candidatus Electrothrix sp. ATG1]|nr:hypothetical protein [Candidatus Electrothrix sp. ATG1]
MDRGFSDEAIVGVKPIADEDAVTYLRVKLSESGSNAGAEGLNMLSEPDSQNRCCYELSLRNCL